MALMAAMVATMITLTGSHWVAANNQRQTVEFKTGQIMGQAGCNQFFGTYSQNDGKITVNSLATTRKACAHEVMLQEHDFLALLESAKQIEVEADMLILKDTKGGVLAKFNRKNLG